MAEKIILNKAEKKLKERTTISGAKSSIRSLGWWIALWPIFLFVVTLIEVVSGFDLPGSVDLIFAVGLMLLVVYDVRYMRAFFGANFRAGVWPAISFLFGIPSCVYLFLRRKHINNDGGLRGVMNAQAITSLVGWIGLVIMTVFFLFAFLSGVAQESDVPECWDSDVKGLLVEVLEEGNNISNVRIGKVVEEDFTDEVRTCTALKVRYKDLTDYSEKFVSFVTYTVQLVDGEDGLNYLVTVLE